MAEKAVHEGKNLKKIREILGFKQETLAEALGEDWNQQKVSLLEQKEVIDAKLLEQVSKILNVKPEAIKNYSDDAANNFINTFHDQSGFNYQCTFNPLDKMVELYERMLKEKDEQIARLSKNDK